MRPRFWDARCPTERVYYRAMSFQAYLDAVETKSGLTPRQLLMIAEVKGFTKATKAAPILEWLATEYGLGKGHGMAIVHVIQKGPTIKEDDKVVDLWLDGKANKPV
jgi:hypothetical protein